MSYGTNLQCHTDINQDEPNELCIIPSLGRMSLRKTLVVMRSAVYLTWFI
jgi:hypothetical protein